MPDYDVLAEKALTWMISVLASDRDEMNLFPVRVIAQALSVDIAIAGKLIDILHEKGLVEGIVEDGNAPYRWTMCRVNPKLIPKDR